MARQFWGHHHFILLLNVPNAFEALISYGILLKILVPKFAIDSLQNEQYAYSLSVNDCYSVVRKLGSLYIEQFLSLLQEKDQF